MGAGDSRSVAGTDNAAVQLRANLDVSQLLYDGGRSDRLVGWRLQLAQSARCGHLSQQEQLVLTAVALKLERSRNRMTPQVWRNHARKTGCLLEALASIERTDRGRAVNWCRATVSLPAGAYLSFYTPQRIDEYERQHGCRSGSLVAALRTERSVPGPGFGPGGGWLSACQPVGP